MRVRLFARIFYEEFRGKLDYSLIDDLGRIKFMKYPGWNRLKQEDLRFSA